MIDRSRKSNPPKVDPRTAAKPASLRSVRADPGCFESSAAMSGVPRPIWRPSATPRALSGSVTALRTRTLGKTMEEKLCSSFDRPNARLISCATMVSTNSTPTGTRIQYLAFDVHQATCEASMRDASGSVVMRGTVPTEATAILRVVKVPDRGSRGASRKAPTSV